MTKNASIDQAWADHFADLMVTGPTAAADVLVPAEPPLEVLTPAEMAQADAMTIAAGTPGLRLMETAGAAVAAAASRHLAVGANVVVMAGPGNKGGDGFVAARLLHEAGYNVNVALLGARAKLKGDAATAARAWHGAVTVLGASAPIGADLIIDALFGTGLDRPIEGQAAAAVEAVN